MVEIFKENMLPAAQATKMHMNWGPQKFKNIFYR